MEEPEVILDIKEISVDFQTDQGKVRAIDNVSFRVFAGETLGLVGESGCGKSVTSLSVLRLLPMPPALLSEGQILFRGKDLWKCPDKELRKIRGRDIAMIFQEPMTALNPVYTIYTQMTDVICQHQKVSRRQACKIAVEMLELVGISQAAARIKEYPHQLSGGMRQRVVIAMALSCKPALLIADEPTTALDVTTQAQVLEQMKSLQDTFKMATIMVTHDLGVVAETCKNVIVMYCGQIVEKASTLQLFNSPRHHYTRGLLNSVPRIRNEPLKELPVIEGQVPDLHRLPEGCRFSERCGFADDKCRQSRPPLEEVNSGHWVACFHSEL